MDEYPKATTEFMEYRYIFVLPEVERDLQLNLDSALSLFNLGRTRGSLNQKNDYTTANGYYT